MRPLNLVCNPNKTFRVSFVRVASSVPDHGSPLLPGSRCMLGRQRAQMPVTSLTAPFELIFCTLSVELVQNWPQTPSYAKIASSRCTTLQHTKKTDFFFFKADLPLSPVVTLAACQKRFLRPEYRALHPQYSRSAQRRVCKNPYDVSTAEDFSAVGD